MFILKYDMDNKINVNNYFIKKELYIYYVLDFVLVAWDTAVNNLVYFFYQGGVIFFTLLEKVIF